MPDSCRAGLQSPRRFAEAAEKLGNPLVHTRGSETAGRICSQLPNRDSYGAGLALVFPQPLSIGAMRGPHTLAQDTIHILTQGEAQYV